MLILTVHAVGKKLL